MLTELSVIVRINDTTFVLRRSFRAAYIIVATSFITDTYNYQYAVKSLVGLYFAKMAVSLQENMMSSIFKHIFGVV